MLRGHRNCTLSRTFVTNAPGQWCKKPCAFIYLTRILLLVQSLSRVQLSVIPWTAARQASLSFTISQSLLKLMSIALVMHSNHCILCHSLLLLPSSASGSFPASLLFTSGGQSSGSASATVLPVNIQGLFSLGLTGLISLQSKGLSRIFSNTVWKC